MEQPRSNHCGLAIHDHLPSLDVSEHQIVIRKDVMEVDGFKKKISICRCDMRIFFLQKLHIVFNYLLILSTYLG